jgi:transcriptional regulator with XRE-family HTH domain
MRFGDRLRQLRKARNLTLRALADKVQINFTYLSKIENGKLDYGDYPSDELILKLARELGADPDELLFVAEKIPEWIKKRILQRSGAFRKLASLDDDTLDRVLEGLANHTRTGQRREKSR